jgi:hypothetical protein
MARLFDADFVQQFIDRIGKIRWCTYAELANIQRGARDILIIDRFEWYMTPERIVDLVEYNMLHVCDTPFKLVMMDTTVATATRISIKYTVDLALGGDSIVNPLIAGTKHGRQQMRNLYIV